MHYYYYATCISYFKSADESLKQTTYNPLDYRFNTFFADYRIKNRLTLRGKSLYSVIEKGWQIKSNKKAQIN